MFEEKSGLSENTNGLPADYYTIVIPSEAEERELREGLRARGFADDAIDEYITVDEAREIIRSATPQQCTALRARGGPDETGATSSAY
jgi:hypothetical protein